ncbi:MAG TPA: formylmethanofuran dehydrogenase subunit A [Gammaproteobacteria bacterium]|nr:formylmethanofuran dehydrogenase subunit A [Gammaproteobacteria bacterium]
MAGQITELRGGRVYDPANGVDGEVRSIYLRDGRIVAAPSDPGEIRRTFDLDGCVVMAGGVDIHTHIGGGKVNLARMLLPEDHREDLVPRGRHPRMGCGHAAPSTLTVGYRYAEMGYTACFEPAMLPANARQAHLELGDTPIVDKGAYVLLGNDDLLLRMLAGKADGAQIRDYIAWTLRAAQAMAIKVVNPGGINAFKFNQRKLDLDEPNAHYGVTPRAVLQALADGIRQLGLPHPLHIHGCNLGVPGNLETTLATIAALDGLPAHLTHVQFHSYGTEGDRKFSSGAARVAEIVNRSPNISMDVGQVLFGQTVTESGDSMRQYAGSAFGSPKKSVLMDIECDAGCGVVPFKYKDKNFVNALQWAIGLELFLLVEDPWRLFLTTDHPNGAPFTTYPHLIRLLTDRSFRNDMLKTINPDAAAASTLGSLEREYSLYEIAIMTRAGPAKSLGLSELGQLGVGARADVAVYVEDADRERMFTTPRYVFKAGELIVENGRVIATPHGATHVVRVDYDRAIEPFVDDYFERYMTVRRRHLEVADGEIEDSGRGSLVVHGARRSA